MLKVHSIESFSTSDGPGVRTVLFLQGCNFTCLYCHNPDTWEVNAKTAQLMNDEEILQLLKRNQPYFGKEGGLTVSGGEPTLQAKNLISLFEKVKKAKLTTTLDTQGSIVSDEVEDLYRLTDLVIFDVKHINNNWHERITGQKVDNTLRNIVLREKMQKPFWLRLVLVPGYSDQDEYLRQWAKQFKDLKFLERVEILPYHTLGVDKYKQMGKKYQLKGVQIPTEKDILRARLIFSDYFDEKLV